MVWGQRSGRTAPLPPGWRHTIQPRVLARDGRRCVICGSSDRLSVDHIGDPLDHSDQNLQTLCHEHHYRKTATDAASRRWREKREPEKHPGAV